jgi:hypothetical protein
MTEIYLAIILVSIYLLYAFYLGPKALHNHYV